MAQNVFRITPRASQVIRAIEEYLQKSTDETFTEKDGVRRVIFNAGDFRFEDIGNDLTRVKVSDLEMACTLPDDPTFVLYHLAFWGEVMLRKHRSAEVKGEKPFVYYTTESINLEG